MINISDGFFTRINKTQNSRSVVFTLALVIIVIQTIAGIYIYKVSGVNYLVMMHIMHIALSILTIIGLLLFKNFWKQKYSTVLFISLFLPCYFTSWFRDVSYMSLPILFLPMIGFKIFPFLPAFLIPGPYWINFAMIVLFYIEQIILWNYMDITHVKNAVLGSEPFLSVIFALVSFILMIFKYRDDKVIEKLNRKKLEGELYEKITKIFLSIRDQNNTPLQNQKLIVQLLKKHPEDQEQLLIKLENSIDKLSNTSDLMGRFEPLVFKEDITLLTEEEILNNLRKFERSAGSLHKH